MILLLFGDGDPRVFIMDEGTAGAELHDLRRIELLPGRRCRISHAGGELAACEYLVSHELDRGRTT